MVPMDNLELLVTERMKDTERNLAQLQRTGLITSAQPRRITVWQWALHQIGTWMVYLGERLQRSVENRPTLAPVGVEPELCECD
jgi:hypothetical protein